MKEREVFKYRGRDWKVLRNICGTIIALDLRATRMNIQRIEESEVLRCIQ